MTTPERPTVRPPASPPAEPSALAEPPAPAGERLPGDGSEARVARVVTDNQSAWEATCPAAIVRDPLWKLRAYRAALYLVHCATEDAELLRSKSRFAVADQLQRAAASVAANLSEGYGRNGRADRIKFLDYALGSARESIAWYESARGVIPREALEYRHELLSRLRGLLFGLIRSLRSRSGAPQFRR